LPDDLALPCHREQRAEVDEVQRGVVQTAVGVDQFLIFYGFRLKGERDAFGCQVVERDGLVKKDRSVLRFGLKTDLMDEFQRQTCVFAGNPKHFELGRRGDDIQPFFVDAPAVQQILIAQAGVAGGELGVDLRPQVVKG